MRRLFDGFREHLGEAAIGSIGEVFDAEPPSTPRGAPCQAWSVAEVLRCWLDVIESCAVNEPFRDPCGPANTAESAVFADEQ